MSKVKNIDILIIVSDALNAYRDSIFSSRNAHLLTSWKFGHAKKDRMDSEAFVDMHNDYIEFIIKWKGETRETVKRFEAEGGQFQIHGGFFMEYLLYKLEGIIKHGR